ncbi:MAG: adenine deaminase [Candidatus Hodarchaeales archaeon]
MIFPERIPEILIQSSLGEIPADLVIKNVNLVNVDTCEVIDDVSIAVKSGRISRVGNCQDIIETAELVIDGKDRYLLPGLIDSHIHLESSMLNPAEFTRIAVSHGTTAAVIDPHELANVLGERILHLLADILIDMPVRYFIEIPSCVPSLPGFETSENISSAQIGKMLRDGDKFIALAEMMNYPGVLFRDEEVMSKIKAALSVNKLVEGHAPGLSGKELNAYLSSGISSDHEATRFEEALEKLRLGCKVQIRQGSFTKDLINILKPLIKTGIDTRNCLIASDDRNSADLIEGHINNHLRIMVNECGMDPVKAIQMCTLNTATHLKIHADYGSIAPGKVADFVIMDNLKSFNATETVFNGQLVYSKKDGIQPDSKEWVLPQWALNTVSLPDISAEKLEIRSKNVIDGTTRVRVIKLLHDSVLTDMVESDLRVENSVIKHEPEHDILPIYVIDRRYNTGNIGKGYVTGLAISDAAIASTVAHDSHQLVVSGTSIALILRAIQVIQQIKGGLVVVSNDKVFSLPLELGGLINISLKAEEVAKKLSAMHEVVESPLGDPFMALSFTALPVIPSLKITDRGLVDVTQFKLVDLEL